MDINCSLKTVEGLVTAADGTAVTVVISDVVITTQVTFTSPDVLCLPI